MIEQTEKQQQAMNVLMDKLRASTATLGRVPDVPGAVVMGFNTPGSQRNNGSSPLVTVSAEGEVLRVQLRHVIEAGSGGYDTTDETEKPYGAKIRGFLAAGAVSGQ